MVKKNGLYSNGKQRWYCEDCKRSFHWGNTASKHLNEQVWFKKWITEGYSVRQITQQSGHSKNKLFRIVDQSLKEEPSNTTDRLEKHRYLIFDGTFLHRPKSMVVLMDALDNKIFSGKYGVSENSESQLTGYFEPLRANGLSPVSCTLDGNPQAIKVIKKIWPDIIIQRCLVHIQRQGLSWCRRYPKSVYARQLRKIFLRVTAIKTKEELSEFFKLVIQWERRYGRDIGRKPEKGWVFSDIKKARSMLIKALPDMFHYLDDPSIPFTTNGLESYFSRLKGHYRQHRGLSKKKLENYFNWYLFFKPK